MSGLHERHSSHGDDGWDSVPARSDLVRYAANDDPEPARWYNSRTSSRRWCRRKKGAEHTPEVRTAPPGGRARWRRWTECGWHPVYSHRQQGYVLRWCCRCEEACTTCGKLLTAEGDLPVRECLSYPGTKEQLAAGEAELAVEAERYEAREARWAARTRRRPVITGRQGYRRPKAGR